jgi:uncharacterized BrkB/YihY/UPF0761 family membrane protein
VRKPNLQATAELLAALVGFFVISGLANAARDESARGGALVTLAVLLPYAALWLLVSLRLPHAQAGWRDLIPGSLLFAVGAEALHLFTAYVIGPQASSKEGTYGTLGVAAALLLGLFLLSRLAIASAVLNATLWRRRTRRAGGTAP